MVSPAPDASNSNTASSSEAAKKPTKTPEEIQEAEDIAFKLLLDSQRKILSKLDFGNSNSELQFVEGPDNLPLVSPHNSAHFTANDDYMYQQQQQKYNNYSQFPPQQNPSNGGFAQDSSTIGLGDDRFILDSINIGSTGSGNAYEDQLRRQRKREQQGRVDTTMTWRRNKKRRNTPDVTAYDNLLPTPAALADLDQSSSSLLLDDLNVKPKAVPTTVSPKKEKDVMDTSCGEDGQPTAQIYINMEQRNRPPLPGRTGSRDSWKVRRHPSGERIPRRPSSERIQRRRSGDRIQRRISGDRVQRRPSADMSIEDKRAMWKPRRGRRASAISGESDQSLHVEDLNTTNMTTPEPSQANQVSMDNMDMSSSSRKRCPGRTYSSDSAGSALSDALQQSIGSTKHIQDWDTQMGLKRSHSKTMRQSSKSREQLLALFTKEQQDMQAMDQEANIPQTIGAPSAEDATIVAL